MTNPCGKTFLSLKRAACWVSTGDRPLVWIALLIACLIVWLVR